MSKRNDILSATLDLIVEESIQAVTLAKILKKADVGSGTLYNYFSSKDQLIHALYEEINTKMSEIILSNYVSTESVRLRFDRLSLNFLEYSIKYFHELNFVEQYCYLLHKTNDSESILDNDFFNETIALVEEGQKQKIIKDLDIPILTEIVSGIIISIAKGYYNGKCELDEHKILDIINACWDAIKA